MTRMPDLRAAAAALVLTGPSGTDTTALTRFATRLTAQARETLREALREAASSDNDRRLIAAIRPALAAAGIGDEAAGVLFHTMDFDNGYFLVEYGTVYFSDGDVDDHFDFGREVSRLLTDEFGPRGEKTTVLVDLRTNTVDVDDYRDDPVGELGLRRSPENRPDRTLR